MQALRDETTHVLLFSLCSESESSSLIWESPPKTLPGVITNYVPASLVASVCDLSHAPANIQNSDYKPPGQFCTSSISPTKQWVLWPSPASLAQIQSSRTPVGTAAWLG